MKKFYFTAGLLLSVLLTFSQVAPDKYWVRFTDKNNSPYSINNPEAYLSSKAIERRTKQGIDIVETDLPVNPQYIQSVEETGVTIYTVSKWLNSVTIYTTDQSALNTISNFSFVESITKAGGGNKLQYNNFEGKSFFNNETFGPLAETGTMKSTNATDSYDYGSAYNQIHMLNGDILHNMGYDGAGMTIAVLDAGFLNADNLSVFDSLWMNGQILGYKDFVSPFQPHLFDSHYHGSMVLSTMGGNLPGELVGTAPKADFWLLRSEDGDTEYFIEELNWVSAAEFADSVGADVINSSLGYTTFDDPTLDHTYADMDGNTTPITIGADMAASKGLIVCNSAGNSGGSSWQYIGAPADGDSVFTVGAVDASGNYASFSSTGPTYDGRIKPNVVAQGQGSTIIDPWSGQVSSGSGTSFSSPITAGMVACLWQANPMKRNTEIMDAIQEAGSLASNPNNQLGWGIPDYALANNILTIIDNKIIQDNNLMIFPNPFSSEFTVTYLQGNTSIDRIQICDITGRSLFVETESGKTTEVRVTGLSSLSQGFYLVKISSGNETVIKKVLKK